MDLPTLRTCFPIKGNFFVLPTIIPKQCFVELEIATQPPLSSVKIEVLLTVSTSTTTWLFFCTFIREHPFLASRKNKRN